MKKVVVTGGAGFIGSNLVDALIERGYEVHVVDSLVAGKKEHVHRKAKLHVVDVRDRKKLEKIFKNATCVFHLAALPKVQYSIENPEETASVNVDGTLAVLTVAKKMKVGRVIYSASSAVYGDADTLPLHEDLPARPVSPYGLQKYIGEHYARLWSEVYGLSTVSLRYFNVYGPRQSEEGAYALVIARFLKQRREGGPMTITGDGTQTRDFTHVRDVVRANILAAESEKVGKGEVINIGSGRSISVIEIARHVGGPITHVPPRLEPKHSRADNKRAKKLIGWKPQEKFEVALAELKKLYL
jgi:UDP-glucose 4-epimerase